MASGVRWWLICTNCNYYLNVSIFFNKIRLFFFCCLKIRYKYVHLPSLNSYSCSVNKFSSLDCLERLLGSFVSPLFTRLGPPVSHLSSCILFLLLFFPAELNCVFVPINLIKSLIAFANHPASSCCCCLLLSLISEITGPLLEHRATDNNPLSVCVCVCVCIWKDIIFFPQ